MCSSSSVIVFYYEFTHQLSGMRSDEKGCIIAGLFQLSIIYLEFQLYFREGPSRYNSVFVSSTPKELQGTIEIQWYIAVILAFGLDYLQAPQYHMKKMSKS